MAWRTLEADLTTDCQTRAYVPGYWSDWYSHAALTLANLYRWRADTESKTVQQWLQDVVDSGDMERQICHLLGNGSG